MSSLGDMGAVEREFIAEQKLDLAYANALDGIETFPRQWQSTDKGSASGRLVLAFFTPTVTRTCTQLLVSTGATAAGATPTLARMAVYTIAANGDGTIVAAIANDTTLFAAANAEYARSFAADGGLGLTNTSYTYVPGRRYAHGVLVVTGAAMPNFTAAGPRGNTNTGARAPRVNGYLSGLADLPATFLAANVTVDSQTVWSAAI
jgi:hypothetical protein